MTNEVPDIVVDLPTYEQVEDIKNVVDNTGGVTVDIDNKRYKSVVTSPYNLATGVGEGVWDNFTKDMQAKFPEVASKQTMQHGNKVKLRDSIYMSFKGICIAWFDASTMTIINAVDTETLPDFRLLGTQYLWFEDEKYLYIRGTSAPLASQLRFGVFDKLTFKYIKCIGLSGADYAGGTVIDPTVTYRTSEIPYISGNFFLPSPFSAQFMRYKLNFDSGGVPINFNYPGTALGVTGGVTIYALFEYGGYIYTFATDGNAQKLQKHEFNTSNGAITKVAENTIPVNTTGNIPRASSWMHKHTSGNGTPYAIMSFGPSSPLISMRLDTMVSDQALYQNVSDVPLFDYENGNALWVQHYTVGSFAFILNGTGYEPLYKYIMDKQTGRFTSLVYYVPVTVSTYNSGTWVRLATLGQYGFCLNGQVIFKYGNNGSATLSTFKLLEGVKEV
ncbi:hypothetical protein [Lysinibacillus varians]|uniref:Uncharacterized protein n=1 Tax=Lysinibacillus varians TaxID=1145276 RepID=A0ABY2T9G7_9BACI|nr:hypothetical protein [Lysinibacillus varians]AHN24475.1 hypothetical protein T479_19905 [Lysinibacillus varians]TKI60521.1 hypothetical protein FC752_15155 [Lysinibacillus varians]